MDHLLPQDLRSRPRENCRLWHCLLDHLARHPDVLLSLRRRSKHPALLSECVRLHTSHAAAVRPRLVPQCVHDYREKVQRQGSFLPQVHDGDGLVVPRSAHHGHRGGSDHAVDQVPHHQRPGLDFPVCFPIGAVLHVQPRGKAEQKFPVSRDNHGDAQGQQARSHGAHGRRRADRAGTAAGTGLRQHPHRQGRRHGFVRQGRVPGRHGARATRHHRGPEADGVPGADRGPGGERRGRRPRRDAGAGAEHAGNFPAPRSGDDAERRGSARLGDGAARQPAKARARVPQRRRQVLATGFHALALLLYAHVPQR
mmetsp:Transcript_7534/g.33253  ORF Transcript_7534/g.33253 Transcript_7534/m.33253 type:complete len:311 (-) Transcript_7534:769-1701(-)